MESAFRKTVVDIAHALSPSDLEQIIYLCSIPEQDTKMSSLTVLKRLEREGRFSAAKPEGLETLLKDIYRNDLGGRVLDYCSRFRHVSSCCGFSPCRRLTELAELCLAQADNTNQRIKDLQQDLERFSNNHRKTPTTENLCKKMGENFKGVQNDFDKFLISPLRDLHELVAGASTDTTEKEGGNKSLASDGVKPTSLKSTSSVSLDGPTGDYDVLEPNGIQDKFEGRPLTTRIPIPIRKSSGHNSPCGSPVLSTRQKGPWGSSQRGRGRDYESSLTSSTEDSGFAELRPLHSHYNAGGSRHRNDSLPHAWRESHVYTSLDLATTNYQSEYTDIKTRQRK